MSNTSLTLIEKQIQVYLQAVARQIYELDDGHDSRIVSKVGEYYVEVLVSTEIFEIAVFHEDTGELLVFVKYDREKALLMYTLRFYVVNDCLNDLIRMEHG